MLLKMDIQMFAREKMRNVNTISLNIHQGKKQLLQKIRNGYD